MCCDFLFFALEGLSVVQNDIYLPLYFTFCVVLSLNAVFFLSFCICRLFLSETLRLFSLIIRNQLLLAKSKF